VRSDVSKTKPARTVAYGSCPRCSNGKAGIIRVNQHLAWRSHTYTTWGGTVLPCAANGRHLCTEPPRPQRGYTAPICPHTQTAGITE
jgi:hypothetical protein